jgi:two-component system, chemotaxis family, protein-glutamate methylesterase/glutaminase
VGDDRIRVLLVDDSPFIRRAVERMLAPLKEVEVVGTASDGLEGVAQVERLRPDVVILDIVMPEVDGLEAIRRIMDTTPTPILVLSSHAQPGADVTLRALELGAIDFVSKSDAETRMDIYDLAPLLREKVMAVAGSRVPERLEPPRPTAPSSAPPVPAGAARYDLLLLGASTGGPRALGALLADLPADFPAGIVIAQHMPPGFTATLAQRLERRSRLRVREARDGDRIEPGLALLGQGGRHVLVERDADGLRVRVRAAAGDQLHRPSVDLLLESAARAAGDQAVAVILTGMGNDGAAGLAAIRQAGGRTLVESEETAVIYGMPRAAQAWAEKELPLHRLGPALMGLFEAGGA